MRSHRLMSLVLGTALLAACGGSDTAATPEVLPAGTFARIQRDILTPQCASCHRTGTTDAKASGLVLTSDSSYQQLVGVNAVQSIAKADGVAFDVVASI